MRIDMTMALTVLFGALAGLGIFLVVSIRLWPRREVLQRGHRRALWGVRLSQAAQQVGLAPGAFFVIQLSAGVLGALVTFGLTGVSALAAVTGLAMGTVPWMVASTRASSAQKALRLMWPDVVDSLVASIRSGANIPEAVMSLQTSHEPRIARPAGAFAQDYRLTANFGRSLDRLKLQWASAPSDRLVETLRLARDLGSSETTAVLSALGSHLRSESAVRQELEARQGWIKVAARIGLVAPWIVLFLLSTRSEAASAYNSAAGIAVIAIGAGVSLVAYRVMAGIGQLRSETRWLA
jgi:tight adherence protein B